jgi:hypothetical protein|tara:strand:+ start:229 stop:516 length:288 start_codon:yes stop_codon:yes gene_type:complete
MHCTTFEDFSDEWWEVQSDALNIDECYRFTSQGDLVLKNENSTWVAGSWDIGDSGTCVDTIVSDNYTITLQEKVDSCWNLDYNSEYTLKVCPCSL